MQRGWSKWMVVLGILVWTGVGAKHVEGASLPNPFRHRVVPPKIPRIQANVPTIARGAALFARACLSCHGPRGDGEGFSSLPSVTVPRLDQLPASEWSGKRIAETIRNGDGAMPTWGAVLSPTEIQSLTLYVESLNHRVPPVPKGSPG